MACNSDILFTKMTTDTFLFPIIKILFDFMLGFFILARWSVIHHKHVPADCINSLHFLLLKPKLETLRLFREKSMGEKGGS